MRKIRPKSPPPAPRRRHADLWICAALFVATFAVYARVGRFDFINFDDPDYVTNNYHVRQGITPEGVRWAFTSVESANWFPLTRLSHMLDCELFGLESGWHHLTNVLIHALAVLMLFAFLHRATGARWPSAFVAFLFALHPLHVESVAWVAERKDVLGAFFWFLALWAYVRGRHLLVLAAFCLGLMAKPMIITLPFVLLLVDMWPLGRPRTWALVRAKLPLFALSAGAAIATYLVQRGSGAVGALDAFPLGLRVENALVTYVVYMARTIWPARLAVFYPYPADVPLWQALLAGLLLAGISLAVLRSWRGRPYLAVGWLWYLGTLVPVIGLVQAGAQARADRYMYVPMVGLAIMLAWGAAEWRWKPVLAGAAAVACVAATWVQIGYWRSSETLFRHALDVTTGNYLAHHNLGVALAEEPARLPEAIAEYQAALSIKPDSARARTDLGNALSKTPGRLQEAVAQYQAAIQIEPEAAIPRNNLANTLAQIPGRLPEAISEYQAALRIEPNYAEAHNNLGSAYAQMPGRMPDAISEFETALRINPDYAQARTNLDIARAAPPSPSDSAQLEYNQAVALLKTGREAEAIPHLEAALRFEPDFADAHYNLGVALSGIPGRMPEAIRHLEAALRIKPDPELRALVDRLRAGKQ